MKLDRKIALVTGGASGIGAAIAERFAAEGATVFIADLDHERGEALMRTIAARGAAAHFVKTDVAVRADVENAVARAAECGGIDIVVNNAGRNFFNTIDRTGDEEWDECLAVDLRSVFWMSRAAIPHLEGRGGGAILNVASSHAERTLPKRFPYAAAKAGVLGMTRSMAIDLGPRAIRVNAIIPGYILTPQSERHLDPSREKADALRHASRGQALPRIGMPDDVARLALFLASDDASFITGQSIWIDGGRGITLP